LFSAKEFSGEGFPAKEKKSNVGVTLGPEPHYSLSSQEIRGTIATPVAVFEDSSLKASDEVLTDEAYRKIPKISLTQVPSIADISSGKLRPLEPDELKEELSNAGHNWFFGQGIGQSITNVGLIVAFPPYGFYLAGNAGAQLLGYKPLYITDIMPKPIKDEVMTVYDGVTSMPGFINAFVFGEKFKVR
jgi:hypothetical protein